MSESRYERQVLNPDIPRLAQQAYLAYGLRVDWTSHTGKRMPEWKDLPDMQKDAWCEAVAEVLRRA